MGRYDDIFEQLARELMPKEEPKEEPPEEETPPKCEEVVGDTEIVDDSWTHIIDNGAMPVIADYVPVPGVDMAEGVEMMEPSAPPQAPQEIEEETSEQRDILGMGENIRGRSREVFRDDWTEHMRRMSLAQIGPNGELLDDFDAATQQARGEVQQLHQEAQWIRRTPPSILSGLLGKRVTVRSDGAVVACARWSGGDEEATAVTVTVGMPEGRDSNIGATIRPVCHLRWGTRDYSVSADVDVSAGFQLTVTASSIYVDFSMTIPSGDPTSIQLTAMLSPADPCVRAQPLTKTEYVALNADATSNRAAIPKFAKKVSFYRNDAQQAMTLNFYGGAGAGALFTFIRTAAAQAAESTFMDPIPIPWDIASWAITNGAGSAANARVVFELAL